jgi:hypothetical protein
VLERAQVPGLLRQGALLNPEIRGGGLVLASPTGLRKYRVVVAMRPWVFRDKFPRRPDKNAVLEMLLGKLQKKELDDRFVVLVEG